MKLYTKPGSGEYNECCTETSPSYVVTIIENEYDEVGKVVESIDRIDNVVYNYTYDELGNIVEEKRNGASFKKLEFDKHNRLTKTTVNTSDETLVYTPVYEKRADGAIYADNAIKGMIGRCHRHLR